MMRTMRASAKYIMAIVAVAFVGWMVFEVGMDISGQGSASANDEIARVNGRKINGEQFYTAVRNAQEQQRQYGNIMYTLDAQRDLEDIWDYIADDSTKEANKHIEFIIGKFHVLASNP